ncbi:hypothetical protein Tco_0337089 [Tanacetum coccineum]
MMAAIKAQLNNLEKEIKKVNEKVYAYQFRCELCKGPHYTKDCPHNEEGKTLEEAYYTQFGAPYQPGGQYRAVFTIIDDDDVTRDIVLIGHDAIIQEVVSFQMNKKKFDNRDETIAETKLERYWYNSEKTVNLFRILKPSTTTLFAQEPQLRESPPSKNQVITEYLVNISKRRAFWSLNEDILKITILKTNTPYPSRKIRRIRACTHQRPQRKEDQYVVKMDDPNITMEEYIRLEEEKAQKCGKVFNWETAKYGKICCFDDLDFFKDFENEFPAIVYNDALTSKIDFLTEPTISPQHIDEFNLKNEISLSECDEEEQNVLNVNVLFPFNVIYPNDSKSDKDNNDDKVDIKHSSRDLSIKPLPDIINTDVGVYAHGSNKLLETSHDTSNKFYKTETFIKELNVDIMTWNHLNKGMPIIFLIKNLYVPFGIPFDPKLFHKDGSKLGQIVYTAYPNPMDTAYQLSGRHLVLFSAQSIRHLFVYENMESVSAPMVAVAKLPVLNPGEFEL